MSQDDGRLPEDLHDIAARLSAARVMPSALELDELRRRARRAQVRPSIARSGLTSALRSKFVAVALTLGLVGTSGVGVGLAFGDLGGGSNTFQTTSLHDKYVNDICVSKSGTYSWKLKRGTLTVLWLWDCHHMTVHFACNEPFRWKFGSGPWDEATLTSFSVTAPTGTPELTLSADGSTYALPFSW
jgi:hypothetical protein